MAFLVNEEKVPHIAQVGSSRKLWWILKKCRIDETMQFPNAFVDNAHKTKCLFMCLETLLEKTKLALHHCSKGSLNQGRLYKHHILFY